VKGYDLWLEKTLFLLLILFVQARILACALTIQLIRKNPKMKIMQSILAVTCFSATSLQAAIVIPTVANETVVPTTGTSASLIANDQLYDSSITSSATSMMVNTGDSLADAQRAYSEWDSNGQNSGFAIAESNAGQYIVWDLGSEMDLADAILWKYGNQNGSATHAMKDFSFQFNSASEGASNFAGPTTDLVLDLPTTGTDTMLGGQNTQAPQTFHLNETGVRYVKMTLNSNYGSGTSGNIAFNEIRFNAVPEPSSTALLGLGGLALILRRRK